MFVNANEKGLRLFLILLDTIKDFNKYYNTTKLEIFSDSVNDEPDGIPSCSWHYKLNQGPRSLGSPVIGGGGLIMHKLELLI